MSINLCCSAGITVAQVSGDGGERNTIGDQHRCICVMQAGKVEPEKGMYIEERKTTNLPEIQLEGPAGCPSIYFQSCTFKGLKDISLPIKYTAVALACA